jgi:hypothetical protein
MTLPALKVSRPQTAPSRLSGSPGGCKISKQLQAVETSESNRFRSLLNVRNSGAKPDERLGIAQKGESIERPFGSFSDGPGASLQPPANVAPTPLGGAAEPIRAGSPSVPEGTQFAFAADGSVVNARLVVPEGVVASAELFFRAEGKKLRIKADDANANTYLEGLCERLRRRGYDAEVED